jgi:hypothetical protein
MPRLKLAAARARGWLEALPCSTEQRAQRDLGLYFCEQITRPADRSTATRASRCVGLSDILQLVRMPRSEVLEIAQAVSLSNQTSGGNGIDRTSWGRVISGLAISYAHDGDIVTAAALVRIAAGLGLDGAWFDSGVTFLLDQQQSDGSFGMLAHELALLGDSEGESNVFLRVTVEVLWALAETATHHVAFGQRRRRAA